MYYTKSQLLFQLSSIQERTVRNVNACNREQMSIIKQFNRRQFVNISLMLNANVQSKLISVQ